MRDPLHPGVVTRVRATLRGERDAAALEALRAAGTGVYAEIEQVEQLRARLFADGGDLWTAPASVCGQVLATWNAFVLYTLGAGLLDADYAVDRGTVGFVPPVTFDQTWSWFGTAADWLSQARQAGGNPDYDLAETFALPAALPAWVEAEPCPAAHLQSLFAVIPTIRDRADLAVFDLGRQSPTDAQRHAVNTLRQLAAEADAAADYASALGATPSGNRLRGLVEAHLKRAVTLWFDVGQLAAMPGLIDRYRLTAGPTRVDPQMLPGGARFDPWCLTDPATRAQWQADPRARQAITALWKADPDPARTLTIQAQIDAAVVAGTISPVHRKGQGSYYFCCPWAPIYQARTRVRIAGVWLSAPQKFTFDVSGEEIATGGEFARRIIVGPFQVTTDLDYCDPTTDGHHD